MAIPDDAVGGLPQATPYVSPTGKKQSVTETEPTHQARSYTLVFTIAAW